MCWKFTTNINQYKHYLSWLVNLISLCSFSCFWKNMRKVFTRTDISHQTFAAACPCGWLSKIWGIACDYHILNKQQQWRNFTKPHWELLFDKLKRNHGSILCFVADLCCNTHHSIFVSFSVACALRTYSVPSTSTCCSILRNRVSRF